MKKALETNEHLIMIGSIHRNKKAAEERFAAALAGQARPRFDGTPLYIRQAPDKDKKEIGLSSGERKACDDIIPDFIDIFSEQMEKSRAR